MKNYTKYKDSQLGWLGEIPEHWEVKKSKYMFDITKRISGELGHNVLSITQKGIKIKDTESGGGQLSMDYSKYQIVDKGDFGMNHMDLLTGYVDISIYDGVMSPDYRVFKLKDKESDARYMLYLFQKGYWDKLFFPLGQGSSELGRWRLPADEFKLFKFPVPPKIEQIAIADFLDNQTTQIKKFIELKEKSIELLKERKTTIINHAVTKGLDSSVEMKDSSIEWLGEIPKHWEVKKLKHICRMNINTLGEKTKGSYKFSYVDIGSVSKDFGIKKTEVFEYKKAPSRARRLAKKGDTIISTVRTYLKAIDFIDDKKSEYVFSTGFAILQPSKNVLPEYLSFLVKSNAFTDQVTVNSKGMSYPAINSDDLGELVILHNDKSEQLEILRHIKSRSLEIDNSVSQIEKEITIIKEYQQSLISEAVTGKIDVRGK
jgi:type I restriction enzyme S subunit